MELGNERIVLRPADEHDLDFYVDLRNHPEILALPGRGLRTRADVEQQLRRWLERWQTLGFGTWTVFDRVSGERQARVELDPIGEGWLEIAPDEVELGCIVHPAYWNQGIATEASKIAIVDFFDRIERSRIVALTTTENRAALRALTKLGMRRRGQTQHQDDATTYELFEFTRPKLSD